MVTTSGRLNVVFDAVIIKAVIKILINQHKQKN